MPLDPAVARVATRTADPIELELGRREGVVITDDVVPSFHVGYTAVFRAHEPVYVTADALLHAWHASYDEILAHIEERALAPMLHELITELRTNLRRRNPSEDPAEVRADVDTYLAVAASLESGRAAAPIAGADAGQIARIVASAEGAAGMELLGAFGGNALFDYSMLKPRGHYTRSEALTRYFRAMSWIARVEARIGLRDRQRDERAEWKLERRALAGAGLLRSLVVGSAETKWGALDATLGALVGPPDSMSLPGFDAGLRRLGVRDTRAAMAKSDAAILGAILPESGQRIRTQLLARKVDTAAFLLLGQRYVLDANVLSSVTYGALHEKRMMPSPLDAAYAALGNGLARELLAPDLATYGDEYAHALDATAKETAAMGPELWHGSVYHAWLGALRTLSPDTARDKDLATPFSGEAWKRRLLNTQLSSWAELRHDNLLYAKQSGTAVAACDYPYGYVDPYPAFYAALEAMARKGRAAVEVALGDSAGTAGSYFERLADVAVKLRTMAEKERRNEPLDEQDLDYLNHMVSIDGKHAGCTTVEEPGGWYAGLHFEPSDALWHKPTIADVHTQPTDASGMVVGRVLHVGTARPRLMLVTIGHDGGAHPRTYRGFVSTYAEVITSDFQRYTDEQWEAELSKRAPAPPAWLAPIVARQRPEAVPAR